MCYSLAWISALVHALGRPIQRLDSPVGTWPHGFSRLSSACYLSFTMEPATHRGLAEGARRCRRSGRRPRQGNAALPPRDRCGTQERARELSADAHCWSITAPTPRRINPEACEKELLPAFHSARMDPASLVDVAETPEGIGFAIGPPEAGRDARSRRCV